MENAECSGKGQIRFELPESQLRQYAQSFLRAKHKAVLLGLTGCRPLGRNAVHAPSTHPAAQKKPVPVIKTVDEYLSAIRDEKAYLGILSGKDTEEHVPCYCLRERHILALRLEDCVYEERLFTFQRFPDASLLRGFEFTHLLTDGSMRRYTVSRVHAKLLFLRESGQGYRGILEARLIDSAALNLSISGWPGDSGLKIRLTVGGDALIEQAVQIKTEQLNLYRDLEAVLSAAIESEDVSDAERLLTDFLDQVRADPDVYALTVDIVDDILSNREKARMWDVMKGYHERLWDAPVMSKDVRRLLNEKLATLDVSKYDWSIRADIARLNMPLDELQAIESFQGVIRVAEAV
jgi:hypothetical protein